MAQLHATEATSGSGDHERERYRLDWPGTAEIARRLTIGRVDVVRFVRLPESDPLHLPGVLVAARGGTGWRVHPEVFEKWCLVHCSPSPPAAGAMNTEQLIEFLAGERIPSRSGLYRWWLRRVAEAVEFGVLTDYLVIGRPRWSPTEAAGVKDALDGIKGGTRTRAQEARHALAAMVGLAGVAEAVRLKGVKRKTAEGWSGQGDRPVRFGARRVGGEVFFELAQLEAYTPTIPAEKAITIMRKCAGAGCKAQVPRTPSQLERTKDSYCPTCWGQIKPTAQVLRDGQARMEEHDPEELERRRSEGQQRRDRSTYGGGDGARLRDLHRKPSVKRKRLRKMMWTKSRHVPTPEREREWDTNANRLAQADNPAKASADMQGDRAAELHAEGWGVAQIADQLHAAIPTVKRYLGERGRSERSLGRREAKQRRRILEHLERVPTDPNGGLAYPLSRRDLQRATGLSGSELGARLDELGADVFDVNGQACVRLVSEKSITPSLAA